MVAGPPLEVKPHRMVLNRRANLRWSEGIGWGASKLRGHGVELKPPSRSNNLKISFDAVGAAAEVLPGLAAGARK